MAIAGFPNLFTITGPGSPSVLSNMLVSIEQHVDWLIDCFKHMKEQNKRVFEADQTAEDAWVEHVNEVASATLFPKGGSWYLGANVPGKPRIFMPYAGGVGLYRQVCDKVTEDNYRGFSFH
jgi:cyclohexanone monooxygenase